MKVIVVKKILESETDHHCNVMMTKLTKEKTYSDNHDGQAAACDAHMANSDQTGHNRFITAGD